MSRLHLLPEQRFHGLHSPKAPLHQGPRRYHPRHLPPALWAGQDPDGAIITGDGWVHLRLIPSPAQ
ncbi:MAG: hypothetical protein WAT23_00025 [Chromatiaceae bacterium]